jgi:cytochrome c
MLGRRFLIFAVAMPLCAICSAHAQLRGHGGPVRALAVSSDGAHAISGSFDTSVIRWSLKSHTAEEVLRFHEGAVNAVVFLNDGFIATSGEDARIAIWRPGEGKPIRVLQGHRAPIAGLAVSPDAKMLASASWDQTVRVWSLTSEEEARSFAGHHQNVNGVAFSPNGHALFSAGYDATLRIWPLKESSLPLVVTLPAPLNTVAVAPDGEIIAAGAGGRLYFLSPSGERTGELETGSLPIISVVLSGDGKLIAAAGIRGSIAIIERQSRVLQRILVGPGFPVWSAAFLPDNRTLLTGGADRLIRRWDASTGEHIGGVAVGAPDDPLAAYAGDPGADVFRACVACHTLSSDQGNRAGPTLAGIFGRKIATLPGYNFSESLKKLEIVWTPETLSKLFELGPATYTPGTKMPEQRIGSPDDRAALIRFLEAATKRR